MDFSIAQYFIHRRIFLLFVVLDGWTLINAERHERYLVFPTPSTWASTKLQFIVGLGLPMEVDVSTIVGYVMKFNYVLPYNASYLTQSYVPYERSINRAPTRPKKPLDPVLRRRRSAAEESGFISRWDIYRMIESSLSSGRTCLLRVICEAAAVPFRRSHGIVAQLLHVLLTPSITSEPHRDDADQEYFAAEEKGKIYPHDCSKIFHECDENLLDYFTEVMN